jgi:phytoene dehydrogenase-like protein
MMGNELSRSRKYDVLIVGGGHNSLVAACYLAKAGLSVHILEANSELGGATKSVNAFAGVEAKLSRYSYLVSLFPEKILTDLDLDFHTLERSISSYTPTRDANGLLISRPFDSDSEKSFTTIGAESDLESWHSFYREIETVAPAIFETFLEPLPTLEQLKSLMPEPIFSQLFEIPLGQTLEERFTNDLVRGVVFTDALIGTFTDAHDRSLAANKCFLYHLIGNGDGQWRVPRGGMGALVAKLTDRAASLGVTFEINSQVIAIADGQVRTKDASYESEYIIAGCSKAELTRLLGESADQSPRDLPGSQLKVNMVLTRLPRLKSGIDPKRAFAGTFHFDESYHQLQKAFRQAAAGELPDEIPAEIYCHTLTDPSILSPELQKLGFQTLTLFGLHTPYQLFVHDNERTKEIALKKLMAQLNRYLLDPIEELLAIDANGKPCIEIKSPIDLEREIFLPQGNIFHGDLEFPVRFPGEDLNWGSETSNPKIFIAGSSSRRGGGVSGVGGHNAAMAILNSN